MLNLSTMPVQVRKKQWIIIIGIAIAFIILIAAIPMFFLMYMSYDEYVNGPQAAKMQSDLEAEYRKISPLPRAVQIEHTSSYKTRHGGFHTAYRTELSYDEIKAYYDNELGKQGWRFAKESPLKYDGQDYGGRGLFYCKGDYTVELQYAGRQEEEFGWTYAVDLVWPRSAECR